MDPLITSIQNYFANIKINLSPEWIIDAIEPIKKEKRPFYINKHIHLLFNKFLCSNIFNSLDIKEGIRGKRGRSQTLSLKLLIQVEEMYEITIPVYDQYLSIIHNDINLLEINEDLNNDQMKSDNFEKPKKRMYRIIFTDGILDYGGVINGDIPFLNKYLPPGFKILINGVCSVVNGIFQLTRKNCTVLGGQVAEYLSYRRQDLLLLKLCHYNATEDDKKKAEKFVLKRMKDVEIPLKDDRILNIYEKAIFNGTSKDNVFDDGVECIVISDDENIDESPILDISDEIEILEVPIPVLKDDMTVAGIVKYFQELEICLKIDWVESIVNSENLSQPSTYLDIYKHFIDSEIFKSCMNGPELIDGNQFLKFSLILEVEGTFKLDKEIQLCKDIVSRRKVYHKLTNKTHTYTAIEEENVSGDKNLQVCDKIRLLGFAKMKHGNDNSTIPKKRYRI
uniref:RecQ-mediated genome instability protein 1 n=1 Tax=Parastrongyloides trichosuri TaxID=131310 RepID=A0A0N4ZAH9_PARTI